jgi:ubiquinone/menaquinone biosynthesis C-methylase UbiE
LGKVLIKSEIMYNWRISNLSIDDKTTEKFTKYMMKYPELYKNLANLVKKNISKKIHQPIVVDLGMGPGLLSKEINRIMPEVTIIGLDPLKKMLKITKKYALTNNLNRIDPILSVAENIPLKNDSVDIIISRFSLLYWKHPNTGFSEIQRVLKPNGKLILETINADFPRWKLFLIKYLMLIKSAGKEVIRYHIDAYDSAYTRAQVEKLVTDNKLRILKKEGNRKDWKFILIAEKPSNP